jgi:hypothetical protein
MGLIKEYSFKYKGHEYELTEKWLSPEEDYLLPGDDIRAFQLMQFNHLIKTQDWSALDNRLHLPLLDGLIIKKPSRD